MSDSDERLIRSEVAAALDRQREQQAAIIDVGLNAVTEPDFAKLARHATQMISKVLDCKLVKVLKLTEDRSSLLLLAGTGWKRGLVGKATVPADTGSQAGFTLHHSGPVIVMNLPEERRFSGPEILVQHKVISGLSVLIHGDSGPYGVLGVHSTELRVFDHDEIDFVQQMSNVLAGALQRLKAERSEKLVAERLKLAKSAAKLGIHDWDVVANRVQWDDLIREIWGVDKHEPIDLDLFKSGLHPDDVEPTMKEIEKSLDPQGERSYFAEYRVINRRTKELHWVAATGTVRFENGMPVRMVGTAQDITEKKEHELHLKSVMAELNHRVKNTLAIIEAISQQTMSRSKDLKDFQASFSQRLRSMAAAHSILTGADWKGASLPAILSAELKPRVGSAAQLSMEGPPVMIRPKAALAVHMAIHELATNAAKYGSLSDPGGQVQVAWEVVDHEGDPALELSWIERGGPETKPPKHVGFGSSMIDGLVGYELGGGIERDFAASGLRCSIWFPLAGRTGRTRKPAVKKAGPDGLRVLIVEDNHTLAQRIEGLVRSRQLDPLGPVPSLKQAFALVEQQKPDAAILDVDLDGDRVYPLAEQLLEAKVPVLFLTGFNVNDLPDWVVEQTIFHKPWKESDVAQWIDATLGVKA